MTLIYSFTSGCCTRLGLAFILLCIIPLFLLSPSPSRFVPLFLLRPSTSSLSLLSSYHTDITPSQHLLPPRLPPPVAASPSAACLFPIPSSLRF
ncbi:uncharacterized protein SCHCODRAFT_02617214 [Schizophyllum commune H4-8]|uniref:uncharacterized protein n=1 Tax=Schizophyllum commune (strain H4-8 / FGSC 9210) TaxID=578458 RepID=UPI00215EF14B|nr:uncharacterized protein SCHCODRAFT_02617214 [Schizophyllum commune H4-8]KAI5894530.1 hypothetical protein SCHCODRAFT_02617214 [Schizophyllum commune H4-8]